MRKRRVWLGLTILSLLGGAILVVRWEPTGILRGLLAGEPFYRDRPASIWREMLQEHGSSGHIPQATSIQFRDANGAFPVLRACAHDPDRNVRWPAIALVGMGNLRTQPARDLLVEALEDEDVEVRLQAILALARWGPAARPVLPALVARLQDVELQVAHQADLALWQIDPSAAPEACAWRPFACPEFGLSAMLPEEPEREDTPILDGRAVSHRWGCWHQTGPHKGPSRYSLLVVEYSDKAPLGATEEERFRAARESVPLFTGGRLVEDRPVTIGDRPGREFLLDFGEKGQLRARQVWVGRTLHVAQVAYLPKFLNAEAAAHFLESFRVGEPAPPHREQTK